MARSTKPSENKSSVALTVGYILTGAWFTLLSLYICLLSPKPILSLEPNSVGDFAAGAAAPLAFLWLVVAVFLQKDELSLQRAELLQSRIALQRQAEETAALVKQNMEAVKVAQRDLELQTHRGTEARIERLIEVLVDQVAEARPQVTVVRGSKPRLVFAHPGKDPDAHAHFKTMRSGLSGWSKVRDECTLQTAPELILQKVRPISRSLQQIITAVDGGDFTDLVTKIDMWELREIAIDLSNFAVWVEGMIPAPSE